MIEEDKIKLDSIPVPGANGEIKYVDHRIIYDGEVCPYIEMSGKITKQHVGYEQIKNDLKICIDLVSYLKNSDEKNPLLRNAIWESVIVKYGRCFVSAAEGRGIKIEDGEVFKSAEGNISEIHTHLMNERNNFAAHSGDSTSDVVSSRLALMPPKIGKELVMIYSSRDFVTSPQGSVIQEIQDLFSYVIDHVDKKLDKIFIKLKSEYDSQNIDMLYEEAKFIIA